MKQFIRSQWSKHHRLAFQFARYLFSGGTAAAAELLSYQGMLWAGIPYYVGAPLSGCIGIVVAFLLHKYFVFQKKEAVLRPSIRYSILTAWNLFAQWGLVIVFVEYAGLAPMLAKILGIGCTVSWNFFLYKFFVYV